MKKAYARWFPAACNQRGSGASDTLTSTGLLAVFSLAAGGGLRFGADRWETELAAEKGVLGGRKFR
jgi:hypothetical protein